MKIDGIARLELLDRGFRWDRALHPYDSVRSLRFTATRTRHGVSGIPTGSTYEATLVVKLADDRRFRIEPETGWFGRLRKPGFEALRKAAAALSHLTFDARIARYEAHLARHRYVRLRRFQIDEAGHVYEDGAEVADLRHPDTRVSLQPFTLVLASRKVDLRFFGNDEVRVPMDVDRDCILYLLKHRFGLVFPSEVVPEKRVDTRRVFYEAVIRFGARLAAADGDAHPEELHQLKRFFRLDAETIPDAARLYNEALAGREAPASLLAGFARAFADAPEVREVFVVGMISVACADGAFDRREVSLLREGAAALGIGESDLRRIFATAGVDFDAVSGANRSSRDDGAGRERRREERTGGRDPGGAGPRSGRALHLEVLGLAPGAGAGEIRVAYRTLVRRYHPDVLRGEGLPEAEIARAGEMLKRINAAYEALREGVA